MTSILLEPHHDDATLFAAYTCLREKPLVVTVLSESTGQAHLGIDPGERILESKRAMQILGCNRVDLGFSDADPDWRKVEERLTDSPPDVPVYAPWPEPNGHPQHNVIGELARQVFGDRVMFYTTYRYGGPRTKGEPVPYEREWVLLKLRALACYESQILKGPVRFWTLGLDEFYAP